MRKQDCHASTPQMTVTESHFAYRIDRWDDPKGNVIQHVADLDDLTVALATYEAARKLWPDNCVILRQGPRVVADSRQT
jgi:hypothetical protein